MRVFPLAAVVSVLAVAAAVFGCAHGSSGATADRTEGNAEHTRAKVQVIALEGCPKLDALRFFERGLFREGFLRESVREEDPVAFELVDRLTNGDPMLISFRKSDFDPVKKRGSLPYNEIVNRYELVACEQTGGGLYLMVVRHDPVTGDKFLGDRMERALKGTGCDVRPLSPPRDLGLFAQSSEDDLLRHVKRGRCRDYGVGP